MNKDQRSRTYLFLGNYRTIVSVGELTEREEICSILQYVTSTFVSYYLNTHVRGRIEKKEIDFFRRK